MRKLLLLALATLVVQACSLSDECPECFTPPGELIIKVVDAGTGENLIDNGTFDTSAITLRTSEGDDSQDVTFSVRYISTIGSVLSSTSIGFSSVAGKKDYVLQLDETTSVSLFVDFEAVTEDCCTYHPLMTFMANGTALSFDANEYGVFKLAL